MPIDLDSNANNKTKKVMDAMLEKGLTDADIREEAHTIISAVRSHKVLQSQHDCFFERFFRS